MQAKRIGYLLLLLTAVGAVIGMFLNAPIKQDEHYHDFSDVNTVVGIPNFWNVISNLPFLIVGILGILSVQKFNQSKFQYYIFFGGIAMVSIGSAYYHLVPTTETLVWDRLPMTIAFMALSSIIFSEYVNERIGKLLLLPFIVIGAFSILIWVIFKDLRLYALVQFYPMLAIPIILLLFKSNTQNTKVYWLLFCAYIVAKLCEHFDNEIYVALQVISGHSLKHLTAAGGVYLLSLEYRKRVY